MHEEPCYTWTHLNEKKWLFYSKEKYGKLISVKPTAKPVWKNKNDYFIKEIYGKLISVKPSN